MYILYLTGETIPGPGGGSVRTMEIASHLVRMGHQVDVVANAARDQAAKEVISGVKIRRLRLSVLGRSLPILAVRKVFSFLRRDYDIVIERFSAFGGTGIPVSIVKDIPLVLEVRSPHTEEILWRYRLRNPVKGLLRGWRRLQFRLSASLLAGRSSVIPRLSRGKFTPLSAGVNVDLFQSGLASSDRVRQLRWTHDLENKIVVVFCGGFRPWDGIHKMAEIADRTIRGNEDVRFLMVGTGESVEGLKRELALRGIDDRVVFTGSRPYHEVPYFLACADIAIAPFDVEVYPPLQQFGFYLTPIKVFEYMAAGLPVVAFDHDYLRRVIGQNERGVLVAPGNMAAMTDAILGLSADGARRRQLGDEGRAFVEKGHTWEAEAARMERLFRQLRDGAARRSRLF